jgi:hypothetical protein
MIPKANLNKFIELLQSADWFYKYTEGKSYYDGEKSVNKCHDYRRHLLYNYPDDKINILKIWNIYAPKGDHIAEI